MLKKYKYFTIPIVIIFLLLIISERPLSKYKELKVHFLDVGQADSTLIELPNNQIMLIDGGNNNDSDIIIEYLKEKDIKKIDYLIGTHPHEDHIGGLDDIIDSLEIGKIYLPGVVHTTKTFENLLNSIKRKSKKIITAKAGVNIVNEDQLKLYFLSPIKKDYKELNHYSAVIKLEYQENSFLFTGDAEIVNEEEIIVEYSDLSKVDVLKIAHHGSSSSSSNNFLDIIEPDYGVISVGNDNQYGHPSPTVIKRLNNKDIKIYRTDLQGTITLGSNGIKISFNKEAIENGQAPIEDRGVHIITVNLDEETVVIKNNSRDNINLSQWRLVSVRGNQEFIFPENTILHVEDEIKVISGPKAELKGNNTIIWTKKYIWNNDGDTAELYDDNNKLISKY